MKKILSLILLSLTLAASGAENLSKVFSSELAQTKSSGNKVTMINSMEMGGDIRYNTAMLHSRALKSILNSKEFKEFAVDNNVTVVNVYRTLTYKDVTSLREDARANAATILGVNAPSTESHWRGIMSNNLSWHKMTKKAQDATIKKLMNRTTWTPHYAQQAMNKLFVKERTKRQVLWNAFNGQAPVSLLLDAKGNVLNKKLYRYPTKVEDYIKEYTEILNPEEAKEKADKENKDDKEKEPENKRTFVDPVRPPKGK